MFKNNFVCSISSDGKFFKEEGDSIRIPFGTEYSLFFKNLESRDAVVKVLIDGEDVLDGKQLIVRKNSSLSLDGFMDGQIAKNKFKFIKRTEKIEDHRGIYPEDGLICVSFSFEKQKKPEYSYYGVYIPTWRYYPNDYWNGKTGTVSPVQVTYTYYTNTNNIGRGSSALSPVMSVSSNASQDNGITVPGNDVFQQFGVGFVGELEDISTIMVFKLLGYDSDSEKFVSFSKDKIECPTCGTKNKSHNKFCYECGTRIDE